MSKSVTLIIIIIATSAALISSVSAATEFVKNRIDIQNFYKIPKNLCNNVLPVATVNSLESLPLENVGMSIASYVLKSANLIVVYFILAISIQTDHHNSSKW